MLLLGLDCHRACDRDHHRGPAYCLADSTSTRTKYGPTCRIASNFRFGGVLERSPSQPPSSPSRMTTNGPTCCRAPGLNENGDRGDHGGHPRGAIDLNG
jgi:hypothetical protein